MTALLSRGRVDEALQYQLEVPILLGIPSSEAMEKTVDEIIEAMNIVKSPPPPSTPRGYTNFWWGPKA